LSHGTDDRKTNEKNFFLNKNRYSTEEKAQILVNGIVDISDNKRLLEISLCLAACPM